MSLFFAELRKVWGGRVFPALLAILAAANLLLLWMGTRPTAKQPPASAYRAVGAELSDKTMEEKGTYLHDKYTEIESLVKIGQYYREQAYGGYGLTQSTACSASCKANMTPWLLTTTSWRGFKPRPPNCQASPFFKMTVPGTI